MRGLGLLSTFILLLLCLGCTVFLVTPEPIPSPAAVSPKPGATATVVPPPTPAVQPSDTVAPTSEPSSTVTPYPSETPKGDETAMPENIVLTVVYENIPYRKELKTNWGFACVISGTERTILFDTGGDSPTLLANMGKMGIDPKSIDLVVLSHEHSDHVGGLAGFLDENPNVTVYMPASFSRGIKKSVTDVGGQVVKVGEPTLICQGVQSTGEMGTRIKEQGLVLDTPKGAVVVTGCAHPGIVKMVVRAKEVAQDDLLVVIGGFHLGDTSQAKITEIIADFQKMGVRYAAPCHCSGNVARTLFQRAYGDRYVEGGLGRVIRLDELAP